MLAHELQRSAEAQAETDQHYQALRARLLRSDLSLLEQVRAEGWGDGARGAFRRVCGCTIKWCTIIYSAPLKGAPSNGAPLNGAPLNGAHH